MPPSARPQASLQRATQGSPPRRLLTALAANGASRAPAPLSGVQLATEVSVALAALLQAHRSVHQLATHAAVAS